MSINFFNLSEEINKKKLLLLVHPDCCIEIGTQAAIAYTELLKQYAPTFDYVITHLFFEDDRSWSSRWDKDKVDAHKELYRTIKQISNVAVRTNRLYTCSYDKELPEFLIDHPNTDIYMSGGYENNCLWLSYQKLFDELNWLLKEQGHNVFYYKHLLFHNQISQTGKFGGDLGSYNNYNPAKWRDEFHPNKITYK